MKSETKEHSTIDVANKRDAEPHHGKDCKRTSEEPSIAVKALATAGQAPGAAPVSAENAVR